jgi:hypothetical protein
VHQLIKKVSPYKYQSSGLSLFSFSLDFQGTEPVVLPHGVADHVLALTDHVVTVSTQASDEQIDLQRTILGAEGKLIKHTSISLEDHLLQKPSLVRSKIHTRWSSDVSSGPGCSKEILSLTWRSFILALNPSVNAKIVLTP